MIGLAIIICKHILHTRFEKQQNLPYYVQIFAT